MQPSRRFVDVSFWLFHILLALGIGILAISPDAQVRLSVVISIVLGAIALLIYAIAIGLYTQKFNRSGIGWCLAVLFFGPLGMWVTYISLLIIGKNLQLPKH